MRGKRKGPYQPWTPEELKLLERVWRIDATAAEIAAHFPHRPVASVIGRGKRAKFLSRMDALGRNLHEKSWTVFDDRELVRLWLSPEVVSVTEISEKMGWSIAQLYKKAKELELPNRDGIKDGTTKILRPKDAWKTTLDVFAEDEKVRRNNPRRKAQPKKTWKRIPCLDCKKPFDSEGPHNRICPSCGAEDRHRYDNENNHLHL